MTASGEHKVFVASSLRLVEQRQAVENAINKYQEQNKDSKIVFSCVRYENCLDINQVVDNEDAQRQVDGLLVQSSVFFLIIEHGIRPLTQYEFKIALEHFRKQELPRYIFVFRKNGAAEDGISDGEVTYQCLLRENRLITHMTGSSGELVPHFKVYDVPFDSIVELESKILEQLERLPAKLPPPEAKLGCQLTVEDFYSDFFRRNSPQVFFRRRIDDRIREEIDNRKMVLVSGSSLSGKTRSVMEALKEVGDGWVYAIGDKVDGLLDRLSMLKDYLRSDDHVKLYIEIDNLDQYVTEEDSIMEAVKSLINVVMDGKNGVIVATASDDRIVKQGLSLDSNSGDFWCVEIPRLSETEFSSVVQWFRSCGVSFTNNENTSYMQIGALFVNLDELRSGYRRYLGENEILRRSLLKAIKAQSIWRSDAFGDEELLRSMTEFFAKSVNDNFSLRPTDYKMAITDLCTQKLGIKKMDNRLFVEEFVYRYIIGYDGRPISTSLPNNDSEEVEMEKELAMDILKFCDEQRQRFPNKSVGKESLTRQVSRIVRRCNHSVELTQWLYELWGGDDGQDWAKMLQEDRKRVESENLDEKEAHFYSNIVKVYILTVGGEKKTHDLGRLLEVYERVPAALRVDELFASLILTAKTSEERQLLRKHYDYHRFERKSNTILAEMKWAEKYDDGKRLFVKFDNPYTGKPPMEMASLLLDTSDKPYDLFCFGRMVRLLANLVSTGDQFKELLDLLRENFVSLVSDKRLLNEIKCGNIAIVANGLTLIDLLGVLEWKTAAKCATNVYGDNLQLCEEFESRLLHDVGRTLNNRVTTELQVRMVVSSVCARLIGSIAGNADYDDVYSTLFMPLEIEHPLRHGTKMILRNVFTYTAMMGCRGTDVRTMMNLFNNDLIRHVNDRDNPLSVTIYTVNKMLAMSKNEKQLYLEQIDNLYDQLGLKRDIFTYNILIDAAPDVQTVEEILGKMWRENVCPDLFTYLNVQRNVDIDFQTALRFLCDGNCIIQNYNPEGNLPDILETLQNMTERHGFTKPNLHLTQQAWFNLFHKRVKTDADDVRESGLFKLCLNHLMDKHPEMMKDGKLFNVVLGNDSFIKGFNDCIDYIENELKPKGFCPDEYTYETLLGRVLKLKQGSYDQRNALGLLNTFIAKYAKCLSPKIVSLRLKLFPKQDYTLDFVFFDHDNHDNDNRPVIKKYNAITYLKHLVDLGIPLDSYVIVNFMMIKGTDILKRRAVANLIKAQSEKLPDYLPDANAIRAVRELVLPYSEDLPDIYRRMAPMEKNRNIAWKFKQRQTKHAISQSEVGRIIESLDWEDANSALCAFTEILGKFVAQERDRMGGGMFDIIWEYYQHYIIKNERCSGPTSFTISLLAQSLAFGNRTERQILNNEIERLSDRLILHPRLLGELARTVATVDELVQLTQALQHLGCRPNLQTAETYVFYLVRRLMYTDEYHTRPILKDLLDYVFGSQDNRNPDVLRTGDRGDLLLDYYEEVGNISESLLQSLLYANDFFPTNQYSVDQITQRLLTYPDGIVAALMNRLVNDTNKHYAQIYVPKLFNKRRTYTNKVLSFLTEPDQLPIGDMEKYNKLLQDFYTYNCDLPESAIPNLLRSMSVFATDQNGLERLLNMYVNIVRNYLRQGDLLMKTATDRYYNWCHRPLDCVGIYDKIDTVLYLKLLRLIVQTRVQITDRSKEYIALRKEQLQYTNMVNNGETSIEKLEELPQLWYELWNQTNHWWKPDENLILAMIKVYIDQSHLVPQYVVAVSKAVGLSTEKKHLRTRIRCNSIGRFSRENAFYVEVATTKLEQLMPPPFIVDLCKRIFRGVAGNVIKDSQESFITWIQERKVKDAFNQINTLIPLLIRSGWIISPQLIVAMIGVFANIPDGADWQIASISEELSIAESKNYKSMMVRYDSLCSHPTQSSLFVRVDTDKIKQALPHPYIVGLCTKCRRTIDFKIIKESERDYLVHVLNGEISVDQLHALRSLWSKAKWRPSEQLREKVEQGNIRVDGEQ